MRRWLPEETRKRLTEVGLALTGPSSCSAQAGIQLHAMDAGYRIPGGCSSCMADEQCCTSTVAVLLLPITRATASKDGMQLDRAILGCYNYVPVCVQSVTRGPSQFVTRSERSTVVMAALLDPSSKAGWIHKPAH